MPDPKRPTLKLVDIDETLNDPTSYKGQLAASIREGRRREKAEQAKQAILIATKHQGEVEGLKSAHTDELNRSGRIVSRAAHRDGVLQGIVGGMLLAIALSFATWIILREIVITNTATQRVNYPNPPAIEFEDAPAQYERVNPREPGTAN